MVVDLQKLLKKFVERHGTNNFFPVILSHCVYDQKLWCLLDMNSISYVQGFHYSETNRLWHRSVQRHDKRDRGMALGVYKCRILGLREQYPNVASVT